MSNYQSPIAVVDASGMVWMNPADIEQHDSGVRLLYTKEQVAQALAEMNERMQLSARNARERTSMTLEQARAAAEEVALAPEDIAFKHLSEVLKPNERT